LKILLDTCVWGGVAAELRSAEYDVVWMGEFPEDPGDEEILERAFRDNRLLITLDKDFGELAVAQKKPHCGIIRLVNFSIKHQAAVCLRILSTYNKELLAQAIITAEWGRIRIRQREPIDA
jgi:predicted nuclease of predicted toxin-antitoxin system